MVYSFDSNGTTYFSYTNSIVGDAHSVQPFDMSGGVPTNGTIVSGLHTHPNSNNFSQADMNWAKNNSIGIYVVSPNRSLQLHSDNGNGYVTTTVAIGLQTRQLSAYEQYSLQQQYQAQWNTHIQAACGFNCANMTWLTP